MEHSGLQFGGLPIYCGKQEQLGVPPMSLHSAFAPHGDGTHGFVIIGCIETSGAVGKLMIKYVSSV